MKTLTKHPVACMIYLEIIFLILQLLASVALDRIAFTMPTMLTFYSVSIALWISKGTCILGSILAVFSCVKKLAEKELTEE